jgi:hypothetical protein
MGLSNDLADWVVMSIDYAMNDWNGDAYDDESGIRFHELFFTDEMFEF